MSHQPSRRTIWTPKLLFPDRQPTGDGILPSQEIRDFVHTGIVSGSNITEDQIQPSSIDLRLSREAYRVLPAFCPENPPRC